MVDVFISYARDNHDVARRLAEAVSREGYRVWWDEEIPPHLSYSQLIGEKIENARAAIVIWSRAAAASEWVRAEADLARAAHKLIQTSVDGTSPPLPFNLIQFAAIGDWSGEPDHPGWRAVRTSLMALCGPPSPQPVAEPVPLPPPSPPPPAPQSLSALSMPVPVKRAPLGYMIGGVAGAVLITAGVLIWLRVDPLVPQEKEEVVENRPAPQALVSRPAPPSPVPVPAPTPAIAPAAPQPADPAAFTAPGIVNGAGAVEVRAGPAPGFGVVARINPGDDFTTYAQTGDWWRVRTAAGRVGFAQAARVRVMRPGENLTMDGRWNIGWTWQGTRHAALMQVDGDSASVEVTIGDTYRIREDCAVRTAAPDVRIRCRNVRIIAGKGDYSPDRFNLRLTEARTVQGQISDGNGHVAATFTRR